MIQQDVLRTSVTLSFCLSGGFFFLYPTSFLASTWSRTLLFFCCFCIRFPEIRYFQDDDVRTKLTDILFCYARENEQLLYKQVRLTHWANGSFTELQGKSQRPLKISDLGFPRWAVALIIEAYTVYICVGFSVTSELRQTKCLCNLIIISPCNRCQRMNRRPIQHLYCKLEVTHGRAVVNNIKIKAATAD